MIPVVSIICATYASFADLQGQANGYFNAWHDKTPAGFKPLSGGYGGQQVLATGEMIYGAYSAIPLGTEMIISSDRNPISADFRFVLQGLSHQIYVIQPISATVNTDTVTYDNRPCARAA